MRSVPARGPSHAQLPPFPSLLTAAGLQFLGFSSPSAPTKGLHALSFEDSVWHPRATVPPARSCAALSAAGRGGSQAGTSPSQIPPRQGIPTPVLVLFQEYCQEMQREAPRGGSPAGTGAERGSAGAG